MNNRNRKASARPQNYWGTAKRLFSYMVKGHVWAIIMVVVCVLVSSIANVMGSLFIQTLIDKYIIPLSKAAHPEFSGLLRAVIQMGLIYLTGVLATYVYNRTMSVTTQGVLKTLRDDMFKHMQYLPVRYFDTHSYGDVMSCYTNDTDTLRQVLSQSFPMMVSSIVTIVSVFVAMLRSSLYLTAVVILFLIAILYVTKLVGGASAKYFMAQQKIIGKTNGYIEEMMNGQKVVKVFCHENISKKQFDELNDELCSNSTKANRYANILMPIIGNISNLQFVVIAIVGGVMAIKGFGGLTLGIIASFIQLSRSFTMPISQISMQLNAVAMALAGAERIFALLDEPVEVDDGYVQLVNAKYVDGVLTPTKEKTDLWAWEHPHKDGSPTTYTELKGDVRMFDVDFNYNPDKQVLFDLSLYAKPGQKVAFVGQTGAGKTTIMNLLNRFYDIADGKIRYDDININKIKKADLRRSLGMVPQEVNLFTGTVMDNIRYGNLSATDEQCMEAARLVNADGFIRMLPNGYQTVLTGDGSGLSQGQRQLLSIARAAVADPPVMILDEATSSIDTRTEIIVQKGMDALMKNRTTFVIAHRLSTVMNANVIIVLDHGRIIERGTHQELLDAKGTYYKLYTGALELK